MVNVLNNQDLIKNNLKVLYFIYKVCLCSTYQCGFLRDLFFSPLFIQNGISKFKQNIFILFEFHVLIQVYEGILRMIHIWIIFFDYFIKTTIDTNSVEHKDRKRKKLCLQETPFVRLRRSFSSLKDILSSTS